MTGEELRAAIKESGITPQQFVERYVKAKGATNDDRARKSAVRTARRWLSESKRLEELGIQAKNRSAAATAAGVDEAALLPPDDAANDRLGELASTVGDLLDRMLKAERKATRLQTRVRALEVQLAAGASAPRDPREQTGP